MADTNDSSSDSSFSSSLIVTAFSAGSSAPLRWLSNLADAPLTLTWPEDVESIPAHLRGATCDYDSSEHAYQALRSLDAATARAFETGGSVSMEVFRAFPVCKGKGNRYTVEDLYLKKEAHWGKRGCRGIAAKMVVGLSAEVAQAALGLRLMGRQHSERRETLEAEWAVWEPILRAKFSQNTGIRSVLLGTAPGLLVEAGRFKQATQYWSAFVEKKIHHDDDEGGGGGGRGGFRLIGHNMMGRLLMRVREHYVLMLAGV
jgi:predicted NAD-dependent protein-ADP-ribosyltransferase YbiA (DUF1768 family)